ncbi:MAG: hypothetical protein P8186_13780 [Anaerolineae bacterium]
MGEQPGLIVLFGSGETSATGRKIYDWLMRRLSSPIRMAVLETPAGFELNSAQVAGRVAEFLRHRLQNYRPEVTVVPARKRGTAFSPDDAEITAPLLQANAIFMGPGSPTYAVRQLQGSLAWHRLVARHRMGAAVILASAATVAASVHTLPVYEIYKVGEGSWGRGASPCGEKDKSAVSVGAQSSLSPNWGLSTCRNGELAYRLTCGRRRKLCRLRCRQAWLLNRHQRYCA